MEINLPTSEKVVAIPYKDLVAFFDKYQNNSDDVEPSEMVCPELMIKIDQAFGSSINSLGILAITDVPNFNSLRSKLLPLSRQLAENISREDLDGVTVEAANYQVGWSHGKERVEGGDKFDTAKGSFYANPITDDLLESIFKRGNYDDGTHDDREVYEEGKFSFTKDVRLELTELAKNNPAFFAPNVWPTSSLPELEVTFKKMGLLICQVGRIIAALCDAFVSKKCPEIREGKLEAIMHKSLNCKARLLHYFSNDALNNNNKNGSMPHLHNTDSDFSTWCGWHNDHGSLTGLVPAMYLDKDGVPMECPDASAGLYIKSRCGKVIQVKLPFNSLAFQVGETMQIHTGGILQATPHAVRGCTSEVLCTRESFAVFMEPEFHGLMEIPSGRTLADTQKKDVEKFLPQTVKPLRSRWTSQGMTFGEFSNATFAAFN